MSVIMIVVVKSDDLMTQTQPAAVPQVLNLFLSVVVTCLHFALIVLLNSVWEELRSFLPVKTVEDLNRRLKTCLNCSTHSINHQLCINKVWTYLLSETIGPEFSLQTLFSCERGTMEERF